MLACLLPLSALPPLGSIVNARHRGELVDICNQLDLTGNAAEVGVFRAGFSQHNLQRWKGSKYYMIDAWAHRANDTGSTDKNPASLAWHESNYRRALANVAPWRPPRGERAVVVRRFAEAAVLEFRDGFFDFIYVDAGHEYDNVYRDLRLWWPKLRSGGMLAGDDFADAQDTFPQIKTHAQFGWGVKSAVARFSREVGSPFFLTFADRNHLSTEQKPAWGLEFGEGHDAQAVKRGGSRGQRARGSEAWPRPTADAERKVRPAEFYPAWYMFKP